MSLLPEKETGETRYDEALRQLASDDIMRDARYRYDHDNLCYVQEPDPVIRTDVTPAEHALLLAARKLAAARQASTSADAASAAAYKAAATALDAVTAARQQHDAALAALVYPAARSTGEADCS